MGDIWIWILQRDKNTDRCLRMILKSHLSRHLPPQHIHLKIRRYLLHQLHMLKQILLQKPMQAIRLRVQLYIQHGFL